MNTSINNTLNWLLERDPENPGVRYSTLRDLLHRPESDQEVVLAQQDVMTSGPVPAILDAQHPDGYWAKPGGGHSPSYQVTVWQIIFLAELGADPRDERVQRGCEYFMNHSLASNGGFAMNPRPTPSSVVHCLNSDPIYALLRLGYATDPRLQGALDWLVRVTTGDGDVRFYKSGTSGKGFACAYNQRLPCAWGATKAMKAMAALPDELRTSAVEHATRIGIDFLLSRDLAKADYPYTNRINSSWFSFGFPLGFRSDILETAMVLTALGCAGDPRLSNAKRFIRKKQDDHGRWIMEKSFNGKMWVDIEQKGQSSKWITLRALRVLGLNECQKIGEGARD